MTDKFDDRKEELAKLQGELNNGSLSRRQFIDRLAVLGLTFGAAAALSSTADAKTHPEQSVSLGSTNQPVDAIALEGRDDATGDDSFQTAQYGYGRYRRHYRRYRRFYHRYRRFYRRYYRRFYRRW